MTADTNSPHPPSIESEYLQVALRIEPPPGTGCGLLESGATAEDVNRSIICREPDCESGCECRVEASLEGGERGLISGAINEGCVCPVFREHDCIASIDAVEHGALIVSLTVPDRTELTDIVSALREKGGTVRLQRISQEAPEKEAREMRLRTDAITDKQREAIEAAIEEGYYETPREADLGDLSDRLGVSRSAVSQRLNAVESKLVGELFKSQN